MAVAQMYDVGLLALDQWESGTYKFALLDNDNFSVSDETVDDVLDNNNRITASGYADVTATTTVRTLNVGSATYTCDEPDFTGTASGDSVLSVLLYRFVTDDTDSVPVAMQTFALATDSAEFVPLALPSGVVLEAQQQ